ncbi:hypothetical protein OHA46_00215 [Streptomyces sp. NBC_00708]
MVEVPEEQQDAATALAGSGPAYSNYVIEHLAAGTALGLVPDAARRMAVAAALRSASGG